MLHCSKCTSVTCITRHMSAEEARHTMKRSRESCLNCSTKPFICDRCFLTAAGIVPTKCYMCTPRRHICLSKCSGGCVLKKIK